MPTCNDDDNIKTCLRFFHSEAMAQWDVRMSLCGADVFSFALLLSLLAPNCP